MNLEEENKARDFYIDSDIQGLHITKANTVELNYLDLLKLMHNYAQKLGQELPSLEKYCTCCEHITKHRIIEACLLCDDHI